MYKDIEELFPRYDFPGIERIVKMAVSYCQSKEESHILTIEHIILSYMLNIQEHSTSKPWYIKKSVYEGRMTHTSSEVVRNIDINVFTLSNWYKVFFKPDNYRNSLSSLDAADCFYFLIVFLLNHSELIQNFCIITSDITEILEYNCFDIAIEPLYKLTKKERKQRPNFNKFYSKELEINYTRDLTYSVRTQPTFPFVGRKTELKRLMNILTRMIKNNAVLIGNPGVGKTSIIEALAKQLVTNNVPKLLSGYRILELDISSIMSGTKYRGDLEKKMVELVVELTSIEQNIILFIDEIHLIMGLGSVEGSLLSLSDMLKPLLLEPRIRVVGTTTTKEFKKIEADKAFERRIDTITINEPTFEETFEMLQHRKEDFESNYGLSIPDDTLKKVISLSNRYIPERYLPDKAINLLDDACSTKYNSEDSDDFELSYEDIAISVSLLKNIPVEKIQNYDNFSNLKEQFSSRIIGQSQAVDSLIKSIRRTQVGLTDDNRPFASFMFIGSTGVGKTEIAKTLADIFFSGKESIVRLDMSEYMLEQSVSKLIGSPPGYVGYSEGGQLTDAIKRQPFSLVLFDEIEKAHPKVCNMLLQILDEGTLTDSHGEKVSFKNTIIILTSNAGVREATKTHVGFGSQTEFNGKNVISAVKEQFPPEFLNRIDDIILFSPLSEDDILEITKLCVSTEIINKLKLSKNISVTVSDEVIKLLAKTGYSSEYGARELKRVVTNMLKDPLADYLIEHRNSKSISVYCDNEAIKFSTEEELIPNEMCI